MARSMDGTIQSVPVYEVCGVSCSRRPRATVRETSGNQPSLFFGAELSNGPRSRSLDQDYRPTLYEGPYVHEIVRVKWRRRCRSICARRKKPEESPLE